MFRKQPLKKPRTNQFNKMKFNLRQQRSTKYASLRHTRLWNFLLKLFNLQNNQHEKKEKNPLKQDKLVTKNLLQSTTSIRQILLFIDSKPSDHGTLVTTISILNRLVYNQAQCFLQYIFLQKQFENLKSVFFFILGKLSLVSYSYIK